MSGDWPCEKCGLIFSKSSSLRSHSGHCKKGPRYLVETLVDTGSYNLSGTRRRSGHSKSEDELNLYNDIGVVYDDPIDLPGGVDEEVEDEVKDNDLSEEEEDVQPVEERIEARARLYRIDELPEKTNDQMTYYEDQKVFGHFYYGKKAMKTSSLEEFIDEVKAAKDLKLSEKQFKQLKVLKFGADASLSRALGNDLLSLVHSENEGKTTLPKSWETIKRLGDTIMDGEEHLRGSLRFPREWKMERWAGGWNRGDRIEFAARDPLFMFSRLLMNPKFVYGYLRHLKFKAYMETVGGEVAHGSIMSSKWAYETELELLKTFDRGTILPIILNSDGVALNKQGNRQANTFLCSFGICDDSLLDKAISKVCLGYAPKLPFSEESLVNHLIKVAGYANLTTAKLAIEAFARILLNKFWEMILNSIKKHNEKGVYMRLLNLPNHAIRFFPFVFSFVGDEPGIKETLGFRTGGCSYYCIQCLYRKGDGSYNEKKHKKRKFEKIEDLLVQAERSLKRKIGDPKLVNTYKTEKEKRKAREDFAARKLINEHGIFPLQNPFHSAPMGYKNNICNMTYDILHTISGGLVKNLCYHIIGIIIAISKQHDYSNSKAMFDERYYKFVHMPNDQPHMPNVRFTRSLIQLVGGDSNSEKGKTSHSMGKIPSSFFVMMLFQMYFVIGEKGHILPVKNILYERNADKKAGAEKPTEEGKGKKNKKKAAAAKTIIETGNITEKVLSAIVMVLSLYFESKRAKHTDTTLVEFKKLISVAQVKYVGIWDLHHQLITDKQMVFGMRKPHFVSHYPENIKLFGSIRHSDTATYESSHPEHTIHVHNLTSKRIGSQGEEMLKKNILLSSITAMNQVREIRFDKHPSILPKARNLRMRYSRLGGKTAIERKLLFRFTGSNKIMVSTNSKKSATKCLQEFCKHESIKSLKDDIIMELLEAEGIDVKRGTVFVLDGLRCEPNEESGLGPSLIYATNDFYRTGEARHDFVLVQLEDDRKLDEDGNPLKYSQLALVLLCLELRKKDSSKFYLLVQYMEKDKKFTNPRFRPKLFTVWQWERGSKDTGYHNIMLIETSAIQQVACVIPVYVNKDLSEDYKTKTRVTDRYWYVDRKFMERSGWDDEMDFEWGTDKDAEEETMQDVLMRKKVNQNPPNIVPEYDLVVPANDLEDDDDYAASEHSVGDNEEIEMQYLYPNMA